MKFKWFIFEYLLMTEMTTFRYLLIHEFAKGYLSNWHIMNVFEKIEFKDMAIKSNNFGD